MGERQSFRFRLPWLSAPPAPRPTSPAQTESPRSVDEATQVPSRKIETNVVQRPPFRPAGKAPPVVLPPISSSLRNEPRPPALPIRSGIESRAASRPASPSRIGVERGASQSALSAPTAAQPNETSIVSSPSRAVPRTAASRPASPSRIGVEQGASQSAPTAAQPNETSIVASPSREAPQSRPTTSAPPSPARSASQPQTPVKTSVQPQSPSRQTSPQTPSRIGTEQGASQSALSAPTAAQPNEISIVSSPSRAVSQSRPTASVPPSPARTASQPQTPLKTSVQPQSPPRQTSPQTLSPTKVSDMKTERPSIHISDKPISGSTQQEQTSIPITQDTPPKTKTMSEKIYPHNETVNETHHSETLAPANVLPSLPDSKENLEAAKEETKLMQEQRYEKEQHNIPLTQNTTTDISVAPLSSNTQTKEQLNNAVNEKQEERKRDDHEKNEPFSTIYSTAKQKNHKSANGEQSPLQKDIKEDISQFVHKLGTTHLNHAVNDTPITVITLSGENRGASMQLSRENGRKEKSVHIHREYKSNPDESTDAATDTEGRPEPPMTKEDEPNNAYINSNVQSINNSIVFDSSISEIRAGVQFHLTQNPIQPIVSNENTKSLGTHKAEINITQAEKLTYRPRVRRRCLGGLMMESSDSDPDNPDKPRRHGCRRYGCQDNKK